MNLRLQRRSDFESHALDHSATLSYIILLYYCLISTLKCKWWASIPRLRRDPYLKRAPWTTRPHLLLYYYTYDLDILIDIRYYIEDMFILYDYYDIFYYCYTYSYSLMNIYLSMRVFLIDRRRGTHLCM